MKIPSSIKIAGLKIKVVYDKNLTKRLNLVGQADYQNLLIRIDPSIRQEIQEQVFIHEALHWVFFILYEHDKREDEKLVDTMAHLIYQIMNTSKFGEIKCLENSGQEKKSGVALKKECVKTLTKGK